MELVLIQLWIEPTSESPAVQHHTCHIPPALQDFCRCRGGKPSTTRPKVLVRALVQAQARVLALELSLVPQLAFVGRAGMVAQVVVVHHRTVKVVAVAVAVAVAVHLAQIVNSFGVVLAELG